MTSLAKQLGLGGLHRQYLGQLLGRLVAFFGRYSRECNGAMSQFDDIASLLVVELRRAGMIGQTRTSCPHSTVMAVGLTRTTK